MDAKAINQLQKKVLDLLVFVFVTLLLCYVLVPFVGDIDNSKNLGSHLGPFGGYFNSEINTLSSLIGGSLSVRLIIGLMGEPEGASGAEPIRTSDVSRLDKRSLISSQSRQAGYALSILGLT